MFRLTVLSIVLTFAIAPQATLLCQVWCHPSQAATVECNHQEQTTSASVRDRETCSAAVPNVLAFIREDAARTVTAADAGYAVVVPRYRLELTKRARIVDTCERASPLEKRPLETALRL